MNKNAISVKGNFSWGFSEKKAASKKKPEKKDKKKVEEAKEETPAEEEKDVEKPLNDYLPLKDLLINIEKGEFVCIIGDVGSGKSSLFSSIIGDMIHVPQSTIDDFGGIE